MAIRGCHTREEAALSLTLWILAGCGVALLLTGLAHRERPRRYKGSDAGSRFTSDEVDRLLARLQARRAKRAGLAGAEARGSAGRAP